MLEGGREVGEIAGDDCAGEKICAFIDGVVARQEYRTKLAAGVSPFIADFELAAILDGEAGNTPWYEYKRGSTLSIQGQLERMAKDVTGEKGVGCVPTALAILRASKMAARIELPSAAAADSANRKQQNDKQRITVRNF